MSIEHIFVNALGLSWKTRDSLLLGKNKLPEQGPPRLAHLRAEEYVNHHMTQETYDDYYKFSFVRNPWDRAVSFYKYLGYNKKCLFKKFLLGDFKNKIFKEQHWFVRPQSDFIYSDNDRLLVDHVERFEDLQAGFDRICPHIGLAQTTIPHINQSKNRASVMHGSYKDAARLTLRRLSMKKVSLHARYQDYYDEETIACITSLYGRDIQLLGYGFE